MMAWLRPVCAAKGKREIRSLFIHSPPPVAVYLCIFDRCFRPPCSLFSHARAALEFVGLGELILCALAVAEARAAI